MQVSDELKKMFPDLVRQVGLAYRRRELRFPCWSCRASLTMEPVRRARPAVTCTGCGLRFAAQTDESETALFEHAVRYLAAVARGGRPPDPPPARIEPEGHPSYGAASCQKRLFWSPIS